MFRSELDIPLQLIDPKDLPKNYPLLFEIGLEELPTKAVLELSEQLKALVEAELIEAKLAFKNIISYGTPRRLAIYIEALAAKQADYTVEKKGPACKLAFDENGTPSKALEGFARSNQVSINQLQEKVINGQKVMVYIQKIAAKSVEEIIPEILTAALKKLSIAKPMRWGDSEIEFVRPIHWLCLLYGNTTIETSILGVATGNKTHAHRFHSNGPFKIDQVDEYGALLEEHKVIANFQKRKQRILEQVQRIEKENHAIAVIEEDLLNEVTGLVEWPVALTVSFEETFLTVPQEALISAMQTHQKVFPLTSKIGKLLPKFITISNIDSKKTQKVIQGNARVMRARLADAAFFFSTDCKTTLESRLEKLQHIIFQKQLGTVYQRAERIAKLSRYIAKILGLDEAKAEKAGMFAKTDLVSLMVQEFPELQGTMGYHYALNDKLDVDIAEGIRDQYLPKFAGDSLPGTEYGCVIALADRIDKLVGIFGINQLPTGVKDPFALRRAAIGLLTILIDKQYQLDLKELIASAISLYGDRLTNLNTAKEVFDFILERLKHWYQAKEIKVEFFNAVYEKAVSELVDFDLRIKAVKYFSTLAEAESLAAANKRVSNILTKETVTSNVFKLNESLLIEPAEKELASLIHKKEQVLRPLIEARKYTEILQSLADLRQPIDTFFDDVMVMVEDEKLKNNRFALLCDLRNLFLQVADISKL